MSISRLINNYSAAIVLLLATTLLAQPASAKTFKIATLSPEGTAWMQKMRAGAKEIEKRTKGRVKFKFYPGGIMGDDLSVLRKMRVGQLHGGAVTGGSLAKRVPEMLAYNMPFAFHTFAEVDIVREQLDKELIKRLKKKGFISFGMAEGGFAYLMSDKPIRTAADLNNQKVWAPSGDAISYAVFEEGGVTPVALPISDVLTGLQTGLVNTISAPPIGAIALQWHTRVRYVTHLPLMYIYGTMVLDKRAFNKISRADRKIVKEVMQAVYRDLDGDNRKDNIDAVQALKSQGIEFIELEKEERKRWYDIAARATARIDKNGKLTNGVGERMQKILKRNRTIK
ncbi:MAG: TRAP transporter substrate-binding protein DctP [Proteobacteria bacterium]|nr:TRAP transporter substrate-binding protein DctP [Pseudomonadota bacterium]